MLQYKQNPTEVGSLNRKEFVKTKENKIMSESWKKNAQIIKRFQSSQLHTTN